MTINNDNHDRGEPPWHASSSSAPDSAASRWHWKGISEPFYERLMLKFIGIVRLKSH